MTGLLAGGRAGWIFVHRELRVECAKHRQLGVQPADRGELVADNTMGARGIRGCAQATGCVWHREAELGVRAEATAGYWFTAGCTGNTGNFLCIT